MGVPPLMFRLTRHRATAAEAEAFAGLIVALKRHASTVVLGFPVVIG